MNPVEIAALDALDLLVVVDNESDTLSSVDNGVPQLPRTRWRLRKVSGLNSRTSGNSQNRSLDSIFALCSCVEIPTACSSGLFPHLK